MEEYNDLRTRLEDLKSQTTKIEDRMMDIEEDILKKASMDPDLNSILREWIPYVEKRESVTHRGYLGGTSRNPCRDYHIANLRQRNEMAKEKEMRGRKAYADLFTDRYGLEFDESFFLEQYGKLQETRRKEQEQKEKQKKVKEMAQELERLKKELEPPLI